VFLFLRQGPVLRQVDYRQARLEAVGAVDPLFSIRVTRLSGVLLAERLALSRATSGGVLRIELCWTKMGPRGRGLLSRDRARKNVCGRLWAVYRGWPNLAIIIFVTLKVAASVRHGAVRAQDAEPDAGNGPRRSWVRTTNESTVRGQRTDRGRESDGGGATYGSTGVESSLKLCAAALWASTPLSASGRLTFATCSRKSGRPPAALIADAPARFRKVHGTQSLCH
jgi:hypothetical protein